MFQRHLFEKSTHEFGIEMEHLFHILYFKDGKLLQRVGIFRVQPGILEVCLVEKRELGKLQQIRKCGHYIRMPEKCWCHESSRTFRQIGGNGISNSGEFAGVVSGGIS